MRVLILTCNTGGGHNAVAAALAESFRRLGVSSDTADGLSFISQKASRFQVAYPVLPPLPQAV